MSDLAAANRWPRLARTTDILHHATGAHDH